MVINVTRKFAVKIALVFTFVILAFPPLYAQTPTEKWVYELRKVIVAKSIFTKIDFEEDKIRYLSVLIEQDRVRIFRNDFSQKKFNAELNLY